jgi:hypothetical protein
MITGNYLVSKSIDPVTGNEQSRRRVFVDSTTGEIVPREKRLRVRKGPDGQAELAVAGTMIEIVTLRQRADVDDLYLEDHIWSPVEAVLGATTLGSSQRG